MDLYSFYHLPHSLSISSPNFRGPGGQTQGPGNTEAHGDASWFADDSWGIRRVIIFDVVGRNAIVVRHTIINISTPLWYVTKYIFNMAFRKRL